MRKINFTLIIALLTAGFLLLPDDVNAQVSYSANFDDLDPYDYAWTESGQELNARDYAACSGNSLAANIIGDPDYYAFIQKGVEYIGVSNGSPVAFSYKYKIVDGETNLPLKNSTNWGSFSIGYSDNPEGPFTPIETVTTTNHIESLSCVAKTLSFTPPAGDLYMQIICTIGDHDPTLNYFVLFDDITIYQQTCTGVPEASTAITSKTNVCSAESFQLSLNPAYNVTGLNYQWQTSADGVTYTNIANANSSIYTTTQAATTWYQALVTCADGTEKATSIPVKVVSSGLPCYCDILFFSIVEPITLVNFAGINNTTAAPTYTNQHLEDFTTLAPAQVAKGNSYPIVIKGNTGGHEGTVNNTHTDYFTVYIDFNHNGDLNDPGEVFELGSIKGSTGIDDKQLDAQIAIPQTALTGITYMRVLKAYNKFPESSCYTSKGQGQAEDYLINIKCILNTIVGATTQIVTEKTKGSATIADIDVTVTEGATIAWYATEADALAGTPAINATTLLVTGKTYYAVQTAGECKSGVFAVTVTVALGTQGFTAANFKYYPNPVINTLILSYNKNLTGVQVYNMLGQQVLNKNINQAEAQVNLTALAAGTYLVKVTADGGLTSFKIVKQ